MKKRVLKKSDLLVIIVLVIGVIFAVLEKQTPKRQSVKVDAMLDTVSEITVISAKNESVILDECVALIKKYDRLFSPSKKESDVYKINTQMNCDVSEETVNVINMSRPFYEETDKKFDLTVGDVSSLWNNSIIISVIPNDEQIAYSNKLTDFTTLSAEGTTVTKQIFEQKISLGAVAKGYIADIIATYLSQKDLKGAMVNLGGNIYVCGNKENGEDWNVGIQDPRNAEQMIGTLKVSDKFIVSSGDYQRYTEIGGVRYHHIIDATNGYPAKSGVIATTVISDNGFLADALSTSCFLVGYEKGKELSKKYNALTMFVTEDKKVYYPEEISDIFDRTNNGYEFVSYK